MSAVLKIVIGAVIVLLAAVIIVVIYLAQKDANVPMQKSSLSNSAAKAEYHMITAQEGKEMMDKDKSILLVDVRTQEEYYQGRIAGSILIPDYEIEAKAAIRLPDKDATIIIYCRSGNRSKTAANKLVSMGYAKVYDMGGIISWPYGTVK